MGCRTTLSRHNGQPPEQQAAAESTHKGTTMNHALISTLTQRDFKVLYQLGLHFLQGEGVQQDYVTAATLFRAVAEHDHAEALVALGSLYQKGLGVSKNSRHACELFHRAAVKGDVTAQFNLGYCYETGDGMQPNPQEAMRWYALAAAQGDEGAQLALKELQQTTPQQENFDQTGELVKAAA
jgi:hypothetical protein